MKNEILGKFRKHGDWIEAYCKLRLHWRDPMQSALHYVQTTKAESTQNFAHKDRCSLVCIANKTTRIATLEKAEKGTSKVGLATPKHWIFRRTWVKRCGGCAQSFIFKRIQTYANAWRYDQLGKHDNNVTLCVCVHVSRQRLRIVYVKWVSVRAKDPRPKQTTYNANYK